MVRRVAIGATLVVALLWAGAGAALATGAVARQPALLALIGTSLLLMALGSVVVTRRPTPPPPAVVRPGDRIVGLPPRDPHFTGREDLLSAPPKVITGPPGSGTSSLAFEYAYRSARDFRFIGVVHAAHPDLIPDEYAKLAVALGVPADGVVAALADHEPWLLIFDDATSLADIEHLLPAGGQIIVTSSGAGGNAYTLGGLEEPAHFLRERADISRRHADALAETVGDLPLALELAGAYLAATGADPHDYTTRLRTLLVRVPGNILLALWSLSAQHLRATAPAAYRALEMWSFLGPEPIPLALFGSLDPDPVVRLGLARTDGVTVTVHPLVQALVRTAPDVRRRESATSAAAALRAYLTDAPDQRWRSVLPHVRAIVARAELAGDRTVSWLAHHVDFLHDSGGLDVTR